MITVVTHAQRICGTRAKRGSGTACGTEHLRSALYLMVFADQTQHSCEQLPIVHVHLKAHFLFIKFIVACWLTKTNVFLCIIISCLKIRRSQGRSKTVFRFYGDIRFLLRLSGIGDFPWFIERRRNCLNGCLLSSTAIKRGCLIPLLLPCSDGDLS